MFVNFNGFDFGNGMNMQNNQANNEFMEICKSHENCVGCPMANGTVINNSMGQVRCETGIGKGEKTDERV